MSKFSELIELAIKGGYMGYMFELEATVCHEKDFDYRITGNDTSIVRNKFEILMDKEFFIALGKECGWEGYSAHDVTAGEQEYLGDWVGIAIEFHSINLTESFDSAIAYLLTQCKK